MPSKSNPILSSHRDAATRVSTYLREQHGLKLTPIMALEVIARALGATNWQTLKAMAEQGRAPRIDDAGIWGDLRDLPPVGPGSVLKELLPDDEKDAPAALPMQQEVPADVESLGADKVHEYVWRALTSRGLARKQKPVEDIESSLEAVEQSLGLSLTPMQQEAVRSVFQYPLSAISGESGTGKATILRALLPLADKLGLVAYSARAAFTPTGADLARLQACDLLVLREDVISDMPLLQFLLEHAPVTCRIAFFGNSPGVAPKAQHEAIRELIERGVVHALRMVQRFRQAKAVPDGGASVDWTGCLETRRHLPACSTLASSWKKGT